MIGNTRLVPHVQNDRALRGEHRNLRKSSAVNRLSACIWTVRQRDPERRAALNRSHLIALLLMPV